MFNDCFPIVAKPLIPLLGWGTRKRSWGWGHTTPTIHRVQIMLASDIKEFVLANLCISITWMRRGYGELFRLSWLCDTPILVNDPMNCVNFPKLLIPHTILLRIYDSQHLPPSCSVNFNRTRSATPPSWFLDRKWIH